MPEIITLHLTPDEARLVRLAVCKWDGWTPDGTISDDEFSTLIAVSARILLLRKPVAA